MNRFEILNSLSSSLWNINLEDINKIIQSVSALPINSASLLNEVINKIHCKTLKSYHNSELYAQLCTTLIKDKQFNTSVSRKNTFQKCLVQKCQMVFNMYKSYQKDLKNIRDKFRNQIYMTPTELRSELSNFQCNHYNKFLTNCKFLAELYLCGGINGKIILSCITELLNIKEELQIHCLCIVLKITGKKLSKIYNLDDIVSQFLSFTNDETSIDIELSPTIKCLVHEIKSLFCFGWINKDSFELVNHSTHFTNSDHMLPFQSQSYFVSKSKEIVAESVYEECYDVLFMFIHTENFEEIVHLLNNTNTWLHYDNVSFAVAMILVAIIHEQKIFAGKLLDYLVNEGWLSKDSVQLGINKVLNEIDEIAMTSLMDISNEFSFK